MEWLIGIVYCLIALRFSEKQTFVIPLNVAGLHGKKKSLCEKKFHSRVKLFGEKYNHCLHHDIEVFTFVYKLKISPPFFFCLDSPHFPISLGQPFVSSRPKIILTVY